MICAMVVFVACGLDFVGSRAPITERLPIAKKSPSLPHISHRLRSPRIAFLFVEFTPYFYLFSNNGNVWTSYQHVSE
jgi:hypothetical protein